MGRPATGINLSINVRLPQPDLDRLDRWRQLTGGGSRPEAIRHLLHLGLKAESQRMTQEALFLDIADQELEKHNVRRRAPAKISARTQSASERDDGSE